MTCGGNRKFKFQCPPIKFYWHTAMPTCVPVVCGWFPIVTAGPSCHERHYMVCKAENIYHLALYGKSVQPSPAPCPIKTMEWNTMGLSQDQQGGRHGEGRTYMRLKRPSKSGRDAKEKATGRAGVREVSGFPYPHAESPGTSQPGAR